METARCEEVERRVPVDGAELAGTLTAPGELRTAARLPYDPSYPRVIVDSLAEQRLGVSSTGKP